MSREVYRVPLDFSHPLGKAWPGYLIPEYLHEKPCPDCKLGYSEIAQFMHDVWYGNEPFHPILTGSKKLTAATPAVRARAERNVAAAPEFYGTGEHAILCEAQRLADLWNGMWCHHLSQEDVNALVATDRLWDFTHTCRSGEGWHRIEPVPVVTAVQVNEWSISGMGHDGLNEQVVVEARCEREGVPFACATCGGSATLEAYPGQRTEAEAWQPTEPASGDGWQLWSTAGDRYPMSPVFAVAEELAGWMSDEERGRQWVPFDTAMEFIKVGWAPSGFASQKTGVVSGVEWVGFHKGGDD